MHLINQMAGYGHQILRNLLFAKFQQVEVVARVLQHNQSYNKDPFRLRQFVYIYYYLRVPGVAGKSLGKCEVKHC